MTIFLRRHGVSILLIFLFSLIAVQKLFSVQFYTSHDGEGHVIRMEEFHHSFMDGHIPVRIAQRINYGLGYPFFTFNYPLVYYTAELFQQLGFSPVSSFKMLMGLSILVSGISMYAFALLFFNKPASVCAALFYIIAPYRFLNMYVRGNVAEQWGLALVPLLFFAIESSLRTKKASAIPLGVIVSLLVLSHNITAVISLVFAVLYVLWRTKGRIPKRLVVSILIAGNLTAFFWIPVFFETSQTKLSELSYDYRDFFPSLREILYSAWGFGPWKAGPFPGKMSPQIGIAHLLVGLLVVVRIARKKISGKKFQQVDRTVSVLMVFVVLSMFFSLPYSRLLWDYVPYLSMVQIPWRFIGYAVFGIAFGAGYLVYSIRKIFIRNIGIVFLVLLLLYANRNHIRVNQYIFYQSPFSEAETIAMSTTSKDEHMPLKAPRIHEMPNKNGDIIPEDAGESIRTVWRTNYHAFDLQVESDAEFRDNTSYYPGWVAYVDGSEVPIHFEDDEFHRLRVPIPKGEHTIEFFLKETWYRRVANRLSVFTVFGLIGAYIWKRKL